MEYRFPKIVIIILSFVLLGTAGILLIQSSNSTNKTASNQSNEEVQTPLDDESGIQEESHPLTIDNLRKQEHPGSEITIEETLTSGSNYDRYLTSYNQKA